MQSRCCRYIRADKRLARLHDRVERRVCDVNFRRGQSDERGDIGLIEAEGDAAVVAAAAAADGDANVDACV